MKNIKKLLKWLTDWSTSDYIFALSAIILLTTILLITAWFYWYQFRPSQIRTECAQISKEKMENKLDDRKFRTWKDVDIYYDLQFRICKEEKGLK